jgi:hypothetical protein
VHYNGPKAGVVKRAKAAGAAGAMKEKLGATSVSLQVNGPSDLSLAAVIDKVKRSTVVDGEDVHSAEEAYSVENFMNALKEEAAANAAFFGDAEGGGDAGAAGRAPGDLISEIRAGGAVNWALFTVA